MHAVLMCASQLGTRFAKKDTSVHKEASASSLDLQILISQKYTTSIHGFPEAPTHSQALMTDLLRLCHSHGVMALGAI